MAENVYEIYERLLKQGSSPKDAAKVAQETTGFSLRSGRPINKTLEFTSKGARYGGSTFVGLYQQRRIR